MTIMARVKPAPDSQKRRVILFRSHRKTSSRVENLCFLKALALNRLAGIYDEFAVFKAYGKQVHRAG